jgi:hypothetical protein
MCTVTWWRGQEGAFSIFFNRDERRTRPASNLVETGTTANGIEFLSPRDPQAGGTWLLANAHGLVVGVVNHYEAEGVAAAGRISRGQLPLRMASCGSVDAVSSTLSGLDCGDFAPFVLVCWDGSTESSWTWSGTRLEQGKPKQPLSTSSFRTAEVLAWRRELYSRVAAGGGPDELARYHDDVSHPDSAFNVRMSRSDARTESFCRVDVSARRVLFFHRRESADPFASPEVRELIANRS